jgi:hypothetical protein
VSKRLLRVRGELCSALIYTEELGGKATKNIEFCVHQGIFFGNSFAILEEASRLNPGELDATGSEVLRDAKTGLPWRKFLRASFPQQRCQVCGLEINMQARHNMEKCRVLVGVYFTEERDDG